MVKRTLRVLKWIGTTPAVAVCTACNREFKVPLNAIQRTVDAQQNLQAQFNAHACGK